MHSHKQMNFNQKLGFVIRSLRQGCGISLNELAQQIGVSFQQIQKYEKGTNQLSAYRLCQIAEALQSTPDILLTHVAAPTPTADELEETLLLQFRKLRAPNQQRVVLELLRLLAPPH